MSVRVRTETLLNASTRSSRPAIAAMESGGACPGGLAEDPGGVPGAAPEAGCASTVYATNVSAETRRASLVTTTASPRATAVCFCDQYSRVSRAVRVLLGVVSLR